MPAAKSKAKKLVRSKKDRMLAGVCGGIADYFDTDPSVIRIFWIVFTMFGGSGFLAYLLCWIIMPEA